MSVGRDLREAGESVVGILLLLALLRGFVLMRQGPRPFKAVVILLAMHGAVPLETIRGSVLRVPMPVLFRRA